ncbi:MAG: VacJ family lipoprotein [Planctomycetota bacterium]|jgi:phospholipid-binding lipoprotein MlaA|nr:VacJ family lipoprotein [Planctomycetota bacterium]
MKTENLLAALLCILPVSLSAQADLPDLKIDKEISDSQETVILLAEADARTAEPEAEIEEDPLDDPFDTPSEVQEHEGIADPIEGVNRKLFAFNDKLYFWVLKPVSTGYKKVLPQKVRVCLRKAFTNLTGGVRIANNLLTGRLKEAGVETSRVVVNSTIGVAGLFDPAVRFGLKQQNANLDQTLGSYGIGTGAYIVWPVIGPSSLRGTVGYAGDAFLHPIPYLLPSLPSLGMNISDRVNTTSLRLGEYEEFVKSALDPYLAARDAYYQYQKSRVMILKDQARGE